MIKKELIRAAASAASILGSFLTGGADEKLEEGVSVEVKLREEEEEERIDGEGEEEDEVLVRVEGET